MTVQGDAAVTVKGDATVTVKGGAVVVEQKFHGGLLVYCKNRSEQKSCEREKTEKRVRT